MGKDDQKKNADVIQEPTGGTKVDLGDDLLAPTIEPARSPESLGAPSIPHSQEEQFESARILFNEGFIEDAKKLLRKILIDDPHHGPARENLKQILDRELKDLLADRDTPIRRPRLFERKGKQARGPQPTSDQVLKSLDEEFGLGILDPSKGTVEADVARIQDANADDRVDLGVAFLEMGLFDGAIAHFKAALEMIERSSVPDPLKWISAAALLARTYILADRAYDAIQMLHPILRDAELAPLEKIEFLYLMGLAQESLGGRKDALPWYNKVIELDPQYRDVRDRMRKPPET